jgi:hypothetical protein
MTGGGSGSGGLARAALIDPELAGQHGGVGVIAEHAVYADLKEQQVLRDGVGVQGGSPVNTCNSSAYCRPRGPAYTRRAWSAGRPRVPDMAQSGRPSTDVWVARNLRSSRVIRMILTSLGLGEASRNGQPFRSA